MSGSILTPVRATFRAVAETVVPEAASLDPAGWQELQTVVESALAARPDAVRRQLVTFLRLIEYLPLARHFRRFSRLPLPTRTKVLSGLETSRRLVVRRGFWGLRTLVLLGYYTRADVQDALGYRAHADGWSAHRTMEEMRAAAANAVDEVARGS
ncbi:MAG: hypothetical protein ABI910_22455 [Gemmatimonadota bacterium]